MWGSFYWGRKQEVGRKAEGIVVIFAWLSSNEKYLRPYVNLYRSLGWCCLVCHVDFLTLFFPEKASTLARDILDVLIKEVKIRPLPIVLAAFSGGSKGCLYKVIQLVEGKCKGKESLQDDYRLVGECLSGQIYDSSPIDFTSDQGTRFVLNPSILGMSHSPRVITWMAKAFASGLDALFINRFETERAEYWQTLYSSVSMGPFLIFCSEDDELAPYKIVCGFAQRLQELGGDVSLIKWNDSPHVAHYRYHKAEYTAAITKLLAKASLKYSRMQQLRRPSCQRIPDSDCNSRIAASGSSQSLQTSAAISPNDNLVSTNSLECGESSLLDECKGELFQFPCIKHNGIPKNTEGSEWKPVSNLNGTAMPSSNYRHETFNPIRCVNRSRL